MNATALNFTQNCLRKGGLTIVPLFLFLFLGACSGGEGDDKDEQFCKCIEVTDELNKYSAELFERQPTAEDAKKMKELREKSKKECSRYYQMSGEEMRKRKSACKK